MGPCTSASTSCRRLSCERAHKQPRAPDGRRSPGAAPYPETRPFPFPRPDLFILKSVHVKTLVLQTSPWLDPADAPPLQPPPRTARLLSDAGGGAPQRPVTHERHGDAAAAARGDDRGVDSPSGRREREGSAGGGARGAAGRVAGIDDRGGVWGVRGVGGTGRWQRDVAAAAVGAAVALGLAAALRGSASR